MLRWIKKEFEKNGNLECTEQFQEFDTDTYESFLNKFPDHELSPSVKFEIDYLGKSKEEIPALKHITS